MPYLSLICLASIYYIKVTKITQYKRPPTLKSTPIKHCFHDALTWFTSKFTLGKTWRISKGENIKSLTLIALFDLGNLINMSTAINRMQFLRGDYSGKNSPIRPPWSISEKKFLETCDGCGECIKQCPTNIIKKGRGNYPVISFSAGECLFCGDCIEACEPNALTAVDDQQPWSITASIDNKKCLTLLTRTTVVVVVPVFQYALYRPYRWTIHSTLNNNEDKQWISAVLS